MKRLLLVPLAVAGLASAAAAAPPAPHTLQGVVVGKDFAHHALVVARPNGIVQMAIAPNALGTTPLGRRVVIRYHASRSGLPLATSVAGRGLAHRAVVRGTIVRLAGRAAVVNAGGSLLAVTLPAARRALSAVAASPGVGDRVEVEVEIEHGTLDATHVVEAPVQSSQSAGGELEVRGAVSAFVPAAASAAGSITITSLGSPVTCAVPAGTTLAVAVGDLVEVECELVGNPGVWTVRVAKAEDEPRAGTTDSIGHVDEVEARGTIAAPFTPTSTSVTVTPTAGDPVTCAIVAGALSAFAAGDTVKIECKTVGAVLTLREIERVETPKAEDGDRGHGGHDDNGDGDGGHDSHSGHGGGGSDD
jgi:hypothetical protein